MSVDGNKPRMFVVVGMYHDPRMLEYVKTVLGHGGCNTFPDKAATCPGCGATVASNQSFPQCPGCGTICNADVKETFSHWSANHQGSMACRFIEQAAKARP